jgi:hypothetical protein
LITKIEKSADGVGMKQPDWRAAAALLKFADMKRFGDASSNEEIYWREPDRLFAIGLMTSLSPIWPPIPPTSFLCVIHC